MPSGGKREGAGRPKLPAILVKYGEILPARMDSVDFLLDIVNDPEVTSWLVMAAPILLISIF
jgi:hypothetical protein